MSKMVRLDEEVYSELKARASMDGKTLSTAVYALMHTTDEYISTENRLQALESQIAELKSLLLLNESNSFNENKKRKAEGEIRTRVVASTGP